MAIKLVARPRHGQYEHNKSAFPHTHTQQGAKIVEIYTTSQHTT